MSFSFLFAVHNHQPAGNFEGVLERAFNDCYRPFLEKASEHPAFRFTLHFSGPLWEYMEKKEKACFSLIGELVERDQIELLGGGFYEPILPVIPAEDRIGQLAMMSDHLRSNFGKRPRGIWLAERVWEPQLTSLLARAGIEYTLLDEEHFRAAGVKDFHSGYVTEDEGMSLRLLPIDKGLRYLIPFRPVEAVEAALDAIRGGGGTAIIGDDGEKFGLWPGTRDWVYRDGWLDAFLAMLERKDIRMSTCSEYIDATPDPELVYVPPCSYEEMMEWVLEPDEQAAFKRLKKDLPPDERRFARGGFFRDFFRKYREARNLKDRMFLASAEVRNAAPAGPGALRELYRGQCNDPYWHGVFGGLYLPHLREAAYASLIEAEEKAGVQMSDWERRDMEGGGRPAIISRGRLFNVFVQPDEGGSIFELDHRPARRNVTDILSRRPEYYHRKVGEGGNGGGSIHELERTLPPEAFTLTEYDRRPRASAVDRFFEAGGIGKMSERPAELDIGDLSGRTYSCSISAGVLTLKADGSLNMPDSRACRVSMAKSVENGPDGLSVHWKIDFPDGAPSDGIIFGSEWNIMAFPGEISVSPDERTVDLYGGRLVMDIRGAGASVRVFPVRTLSQSEENYDIIHQGYCMCLLWPMAPGGTDGPEVLIRRG